MKILQLTAPAHFGGLESVVLNLLTGLATRSHTPLLGAILDERAPAAGLPDRASRAGVETRTIAVPPRRYLREYRAILSLIAHERPDLVHTHGYRTDLIGGVAARRAGVPWVSTAHGFTGGDLKGRLYERLQLRALRRADAVIAVSRSVCRRLVSSGIREERVATIPNAWVPRPMLGRAEARRRLGLAEPAVVIGWVGRLTSEKGADLFLQALGALPDLEWVASVIGDGPERAALEAQAEALGIAGRVHWHGPVPEAAGLYPAFDLWVLSSRTEGTPISLLEAMAARVPVVAASVGGVPDLVTPGQALLVAPESPGALAGALRSALIDPVASAARAEAASRRLAEVADEGRWLDAHVALYRTVCQEPGEGSRGHFLTRP